MKKEEKIEIELRWIYTLDGIKDSFYFHNLCSFILLFFKYFFQIKCLKDFFLFKSHENLHANISMILNVQISAL